MRRDSSLQAAVELSPDQIDLASRAIQSMAGSEGILVRVEGNEVDWCATAQRVLNTAANVYVSLLLIQAKREQRGILTDTVDLALRRQGALTCLTQLCGKRISAEEILSAVAGQCGLDERELKPLHDPIRRDLTRLLPRERAPAKAKKAT